MTATDNQTIAYNLRAIAETGRPPAQLPHSAMGYYRKMGWLAYERDGQRYTLTESGRALIEGG